MALKLVCFISQNKRRYVGIQSYKVFNNYKLLWCSGLQLMEIQTKLKVEGSIPAKAIILASFFQSESDRASASGKVSRCLMT